MVSVFLSSSNILIQTQPALISTSKRLEVKQELFKHYLSSYSGGYASCCLFIIWRANIHVIMHTWILNVTFSVSNFVLSVPCDLKTNGFTIFIFSFYSSDFLTVNSFPSLLCHPAFCNMLAWLVQLSIISFNKSRAHRNENSAANTLTSLIRKPDALC